MAIFGSTRINELIVGLFRRPAERRVLGISKPEHRALRVLVEADLPSGDTADSAWLERVELRSPERVADILERSGFLKLSGKLKIMFVDARCGLIRTELIATPPAADADEIVGRILQGAARCDAHGIILASHAPAGLLVRSSRWREIHDKLHRKGEAIEVFLLDHLILTARGWRRLRTARKAKHI